LVGGCVGALFYVGVVWLAGLVRFAEGCLALARLATFRVFLFIVGVLEMQKGPERTPCATVVEMYLRRVRKLSESDSGSSAASSKVYASDEKGYLAFRPRFCEYEYIASSIVICYQCLTF
jgi:hypothetical protein